MWKFLILCSAAAVISEASYDCFDHSNCNPYQGYPLFPRTRKQFDAVCKAEIGFLECAIEKFETCDESMRFAAQKRISSLSAALNSAKEICDNDGTLYQGIIQRLKCAKKVLDEDDHDCFGPPYEEFVHEISNVVEGVVDAELCAKGMSRFLCEAEEMKNRCGEDAMESYIGIIYGRSNYYKTACGDAVRRNLLGTFTALKAEKLESAFENSI